MDNSDKFVGKGRGSFLLEMMKQKTKEERLRTEALPHSLETPSSPSEQISSEILSTSSSFGVGRGRGQLVTALMSRSSNVPASKGLLSVGSYGRGSLLSSLTRTVGSSSDVRLATSAQVSTSSTQASMSSTPTKEHSKVLEQFADVSIRESQSTVDVSTSEESAPICRQGKSGMKIEVFANYIDLKLEPGKGLFQYEVKFTPDIDSRPLRRKLLNQHSAELGRTRIFDGTILFLPTRLPQIKTCYESEHPMDGSRVSLAIIYQKQQSMSENVQFFNVLFNRVMRALNLVRIGRQNFNPRGAYNLTKHRLEVWPGYITAVNEYEGGLKLCLDAKHRVMRMETVRDLMGDVLKAGKPNTVDDAIREIVGLSVLTRYNNKTYRIDDIAWDKSPNYEFSKNGENMSLVHYYKQQWGIDIKDMGQPLLVHRAKVKTSTGETEEKTILLVPELCYITGITDNIRSNHHIMKDLNDVTKMSPNQRRDVIRRFVKDVKDNPVTQQILSEWGLHLSDDIVRFPGRQLGSEMIIFGRKKTYQSDRPGDWSNFAVKNPVLYTPNLNKWHILYCVRDQKCVADFLRMMKTICGPIGMQINNPREIMLKDDRTDTYLRELQKSLDDGIELVVVVFPTNRTDRYSTIKKLCCVQKAMPSQVIIAKTISKPQKLKSVTEKIALQINCKLGGALWTVNLPLRNCMVCGIDVYHAGVGTGLKKSVAGFVASLDTQLTKWHSRVCIQASRQELVDMLQMCLVAAINAFHKHNGCNPDRIIIFRDGVGDGDLDYVHKYEVKQLLLTFDRIASNYKPQLSVVVVQKRINTRVFIGGAGGLDNAKAGTIIDSCVTRRNYYDFFLVPQSVRQGTVTPTHYVVIHDSSNMETDHMQRLTYKLCHLYYNWPGTIRIPAPCQYAHKLAYLVGQNIQAEPHHSLSDLLFYL
ncbi:hypothetical protein DMN91_008315 [Ooceraea biroi]|uniref:Piwi-like protein n=1 Tax=Ooceraea biroi TaxID=2015173 RepID=A0A026WDD8_OOCBI|nr:piwi-like protein Ago3 [Ooceraea biroi]XP_026827750.1 piwi-like protein Ago3 [Ooceraea biroi]EZA53661.1 Piwi-like protein [Ooceraea biroi]RLU19757.1 hypothetical protein DMN91_008315 [Ooceraea biroi]